MSIRSRTLHICCSITRMPLQDTGSYLGNVRSSLSFAELRFTYTTYQKEGALEIMHAHANPHLSFVMSGGNLEKRKLSKNGSIT